MEDGPSLEDRVTGGWAFTGGQGHWRTSLCWGTVTGRRTLLEDRVTGGPIFAGGWSLKTDFAEGQGHWRTGSLTGSLEDRVTGGPVFAGGWSLVYRLH